jgi:hypothetical protein
MELIAPTVEETYPLVSICSPAINGSTPNTSHHEELFHHEPPQTKPNAEFPADLPNTAIDDADAQAKGSNKASIKRNQYIPQNPAPPLPSSLPRLQERRSAGYKQARLGFIPPVGAKFGSPLEAGMPPINLVRRKSIRAKGVAQEHRDGKMETVKQQRGEASDTMQTKMAANMQRQCRALDAMLADNGNRDRQLVGAATAAAKKAVGLGLKVEEAKQLNHHERNRTNLLSRMFGGKN